MYVHASLHPLDQSIRILVDAGDGLHLWMDDRRVGARRDDRDIAVRLTGAQLPGDLRAIRVCGMVGTTEIDDELEPAPNLVWRTIWDGTGADDGRPWVSELEVGWVTHGRFPRPDRTRWWTRRVVAGSLDARSYGFGGFVPAVVHRLDVDADLLWRGDGSQMRNATTERAAVLAAVEVAGDELAVADGELVHIFNEHGLLEGSLQARRRRVVATAEHDERGRLSRFSTRGREFAIEHRIEPQGRAGEALIESPAEVWIAAELNDDGRAVTLLDHDRNRLSIDHDEYGCIVRLTDPQGLVTDIERDRLGRVTRIADSTGREQLVTRIDGHEVQVTSAEGRSRRIRREVGEDGSTVETDIDGTNLPDVVSTDDEGRSQYRANGVVMRTTHSVRARDRDAIGVHQTLIDAPSGRTLAVTRESAHDAERLTIGDRVWIQRFDADRLTTTAVTPDGLERTAEHRPGSSLTLREPGRLPLEVRFDALRRPKRRRRGANELAVGYDQYGRLAWSEVDRLRHHIQHDERGRVVGVKGPDGWLRLRRSSAGWVEAVTNAAGHASGLHRRADGRISHIVHPSLDDTNAVEARRYDRDGLLVGIVHYEGDDRLPDIDYERDSAGRITAITSNDQKVLATWDVERGTLDALTSSSGDTLTFTWDGDMCWAEDMTGRINAHVERVFDDDHTVVVRSVNRSSALAYERDEHGHLRSVGPLHVERNLSARQIVGYRLGGLTTSMQLDADGAVTEQQTRLGRLATVFFAERIERDSAGRITKVAEHVQGVDRLIEYRYDEAGRLTQALLNGELSAGARWDAAGNLVELHRQGRSVALTPDAADRLASIAGQPAEHDPAGRLTVLGPDGAVRRYAYDALGRFASTVDGRGAASLHHLDPLGRPVEIGRTDRSDEPLRLVWDGDRPAATLDAAGAIDIRFVDTREGAGPEALVRGGNEYLLVRDHVGSVRLVIEASSGTVVQELQFDPFGRVLLDTAPGWQPLGFAGGLTDATSGLVRFGARVYDPLIARYLDRGGDRLSTGRDNPYAFAHGDPVNRPDSDPGPAPNHPRSNPLGELTMATDPFLGSATVTPDRAWLASAAWACAVGDGQLGDTVLDVLSGWSTEAVAFPPTFDDVWNPLDPLSGAGGFEYQPSPAPPTTGRLATLGSVLREPPSWRDLAQRVESDLARVIDSLPD